MNLSILISGIYGELRGYHRLRIRREVAAGEALSAEALAARNERLFQAQVRRSIERFPQYAEKVQAHRGALPAPGDTVPPEELPVWTRDDQRALFADSPEPRDAAYAHQTSGSTSRPVRFYVTRESYEWRTAIMDRSYGWGRAQEGERSLHVWAADQKAPPRSQQLKRFVHRTLQRRTYFDVFRDITDSDRAACIALINKVRPVSIVGYTGQLVDLARYVRDHPGELRFKPLTMVSAAEGLQPGQRELLEAHLVGAVFLSYGSREFMSVGMECEHHTGYHLTTDNLRVEVVDAGGNPVLPGETGRIVITDLHNAATPFVRYEIGDHGVMAPAEERCPCGRPFPLLRSVEGRLQDKVYTPDGGSVTGLFVTYTMRQFDDWIEGWQVVQPSRRHITVRLLTTAALTNERIHPVDELLRTQLGSDIEIDYERVDALERREGGKIALVQTLFDAEAEGGPTSPGER